jgi:hypothetical protein
VAGKKGKGRLWIIVGAVAVIGLILLSSGPGRGVGGLCLVKVTADKTPVRSGPDTNDSVGTLPAGLVIQADRKTSSTGFRKVMSKGWVAEQHLDPMPGSNCG